LNGTLTVLRRELLERVRSPATLVLCLLATAALQALVYFVGFPIGDLRLAGFWGARVASLDVLFAWLPVVYALLAPALTMGSWAEELRSGRVELLFVQPVPLRSLVLGKFLSAWLLLCGITLVLVVPLAVGVAALGPLDWGVVLAGLLGAALLAASSVAIGLCASSLSQDELVAFLVASFVLLGLWSTSLFVRALPGALADVVWYASPSVHYLESAARGILDARDVVYHGLLASAGLVLNLVALEGKRFD
jgi:ABC-2 type transport system permease protein